jgi:putative tricarboxylic transport membrane protein
MKASGILRSGALRRAAHVLLASTVGAGWALLPQPAAGADSAWKPEKNVEIVVNTAPGSGQDLTGRLIQSILQERKLVAASITVNNKPGGGGAIAYGYLQSHAGSGNFISIASKSLLTNHISGRAQVTYSHLTPLAILFDEYITVAVKADSPIKSGRELLERLKKDPGALSFGVATSLGNPNHQGIAMALKVSGIDLRKTKTPVFQSGGQALTALLGGHVDAVPGSVGLMRKHLEAGNIRVIAIAAPQRLGGLFANVPTWKEQGADAVVSNWRGLIGPPGMAAAQTAYWDSVMKQLTQTEAWKKELADNNWDNEYKPAAETRKYMDAEYAELKAFLTELELVKAPGK